MWHACQSQAHFDSTQCSCKHQIIEDLHLSQGIAARQVKINQPKISALSNYRLEGFSVERLMNFLTALDRDVDIVIRRKSKSGRTGRILVTAA